MQRCDITFVYIFKNFFAYFYDYLQIVSMEFIYIFLYWSGGGKNCVMYLYIGTNQDGCNLPTKECGKLESLFFCSLCEHISVPLSGSAKHMRPVIRLYVCVRVCVCECKLLYVSVMLHMLFFSQSFTCLVQSCEIIITHRGFVESEARR